MATKPREERKGWYHSDIASLSPVMLMFTGGVIASAKRPGTFFVPFKVANDPQEHTLEVEAAPGYRETLEAAPRNQWVTVTAAGARETAALMIGNQPQAPAYQGDPGDDWEPAEPPPASEAHAAFNAPQRPAPRPQQAAARPQHARSNEDDVWAAMNMVGDLITRYEDTFKRPYDEPAQKLVSTVLIRAQENGRPISNAA